MSSMSTYSSQMLSQPCDHHENIKTNYESAVGSLHYVKN